jgi:hypothetical protein
VERLGLVGDAIEVHLADGEVLAAPTVVLAAALEQSRTLIAGLDAAARGLDGLLGLAGSAPSAAVAALYPLDAPFPDFDLWHPDLSHPIATVVHDSAKRAARVGRPPPR